jgi:hypothetical protein
MDKQKRPHSHVKQDREVYYLHSGKTRQPVFALKDASELHLVYDNKSHKEAAQAYYDWWHSNPVFKDKMKIDPLKNTNYRWH